MRQRYHGAPLLAQAQPEEVPCDPATQDCTNEELDEVVTTGLRGSSRNASITNNQESGVDEGDIVKAYDRFMVVLLHGRLFSVDTGNKSGALQLVDRIDAYQSKDIDTWIDELLIFNDTLLVTGYSYETDSSNIALFHIDHDGKFKFLARYFIESDDYYSWGNYASRVVDGKLVIYTPFELGEYDVDEDVPLPRIRRWTEARGFSEWTPLFKVTDVYRPIQPALSPGMHVVSVCPISADSALNCKSRGIVGPWQHEMYVAEDHAYLWLSSDDDDAKAFLPSNDCSAHAASLRRRGMPSAVFRLTLSRNELAAVHTEGWPTDQFALEEKPANLWALVHRPSLGCGDVAEHDHDDEPPPLALIKIPSDEFSRQPIYLDSSAYFEVPSVKEGWDQQTRFSDGHVLYGVAQGFWSARNGGADADNMLADLVVVPLDTPRRAAVLKMPHSVDRIELFGDDALVFGYMPNASFAVSSIALAGPPLRVDTQAMPGVIESEGRSHAFNGFSNDDGSGIFGIPTIDYAVYQSSHWNDIPVDVQFLTTDAHLRLRSADKLAGRPSSELEVGSYECEVSCEDWYGNARPIFFRDRIFALIGLEFIEGTFANGRIAEVARVNLIATPDQRRIATN